MCQAIGCQGLLAPRDNAMSVTKSPKLCWVEHYTLLGVFSRISNYWGVNFLGGSANTESASI